jgi:hypothetical protein
MATFNIVVNNQVIGVIDTLGASQPLSAAQAPSVDPSASGPTLQAGAASTTNLAPTFVGGTSFISNPA